MFYCLVFKAYFVYRVIVSILDAFHFDLSGSQLNVKLVPTVTTEEGNQEQGKVNPYLTNGFSHHYFIFRGRILKFYSIFR